MSPAHHIDLDDLRRSPDVEGPGLVAVDAADRLILDESADLRRGARAGEIVVIGDAYGALTFGAVREGATAVRVHQDALVGERALHANAARWGVADTVRPVPLSADAVAGARVVLLRLPRSLEELRGIAGLIAGFAAPDVVVVAGGRIKHMSLAMNEVLRAFFDRVDVTHARQKSRVLVARGTRAGGAPEPSAGREGALELRAFGGTFAGARVDLGTRLLLAHLPEAPAGGTAADPLIDLACGNGAVAATLALRHPSALVYASDQSASAVASTRATVAANGVADRVTVARDDALSARAEATASFIALNPPFHSGAALTDAIAHRLFADAGRVLRTGGQLWCVWNSPLRYRPALERFVGPTRQIARDAKFTVTVSTRG